MGYAGRTLSGLVRTRTLPARNDHAIVSFTFDDIPVSAAGAGARILEEAGALGTFYVAGGLCGTVDAGVAFASGDDLVRLSRRGHELGSHTFSHVNVGDLSGDRLASEIERNQDFIRECVGDVVLTSFAYPFGAASLGSKTYLQSAFATCRSTAAGLNVGRIDLGFLRAERLYETVSTREAIRAQLANAQRKRGWLIYYTHDVQLSPSPYGVSPDLFEFAVTTAKDMGLEMLPVSNALGRVAFERD